MNTITINGNKISASGNITVSNGKVIVNGIDVTPDLKQISIVVTGDVETIKVDACNEITVKGLVKGNISTQSGDINIEQSVGGSVTTMSGDVDCGNISGSVSTMSGDIKYRKN